MSVRKIVALALILLIVCAVGYVALKGVAWDIYEIRPFLEQIPKGLDLNGGVSVVYAAKDTSDPDLNTHIDSVISSMRMRLDSEGYTEATITKQGASRIRVEIPINEANMVDDPSLITQYLVKPALIEFMDPDQNILFTGADMLQVGPIYNPETRQYEVSFNLDSEAAEVFAAITAELAGTEKPISILLDGVIIASPVVQNAIPNGQATITGKYTLEEATLLANQIRSGALPIEMEEIEVRSVSATLGEDALNKGILAGAIGLLLIFAFMGVYYRIPGLVADLALVIYVILMLLCLASIPGVQLTLPGIAGMILSIGMAVDANVIIFERMREEIRAGKSIRTSVKTGFQRAFSAIMDSNITTIIAALALLFFGTGSIKGFAITLLIGIILSFFTSVLITRGLMNLALGFHLQNKRLFCPEKKQKRTKDHTGQNLWFTKNFKKMAVVPLVILVIGVVAGLFSNGLNMGVDFTGGTLVTIDMKSDFDMAVVERALDENAINGAQAVRTGESTSRQMLVDVRLQNLDDDEAESNTRKDLLETIQETYPDAEITQVDRVDGIASGSLIQNAILSVVIAGVLILIYIWIRFELYSGLAAVLCLLHDVLVMIALTCILRVPVNSPFIAAVLTIVGYSINNTIVVFDRVRDVSRNTAHAEKHQVQIVNQSIAATLTRSINTSLTTLITITMVYLFGAASIKEFALPIIVGLLAGTYSSLFMAGPLWVILRGSRGGKLKKEGKAINPKDKKTKVKSKKK